jgi:hypothetical protein
MRHHRHASLGHIFPVAIKRHLFRTVTSTTGRWAAQLLCRHSCVLLPNPAQSPQLGQRVLDTLLQQNLLCQLQVLLLLLRCI